MMMSVLGYVGRKHSTYSAELLPCPRMLNNSLFGSRRNIRYITISVMLTLNVNEFVYSRFSSDLTKVYKSRYCGLFPRSNEVVFNLAYAYILGYVEIC
jgi:hypothetical protein